MRYPLRSILTAAILFIMALATVPDYVVNWLWMRQLDYGNIFWTLFFIRWAMFSSAFAVAFLFLWLNLRHAIGTSAFGAPRGQQITPNIWARNSVITISAIPFAPRLAIADVILACAVVAWFFGGAFYSEWDSFIRFRYGSAFGVSDPLFGVDVGFYLFRLPFYELLQDSLTILTVLTLALVTMAYLFFDAAQANNFGKDKASRKPLQHLSVLAAVLVANLGWGFYLDRFELLYANQGVVYGAGYTAVHVTQFALWVMVAASAAAGVLLALNSFRPNLKMAAAGAGAFAALWFIGVTLIPLFVQKFVVQPNELELETPYLKNYIESTRAAYGLDSIQETSYPATADLTQAAIAGNQDTIQNIRLWDARPLLQTYQQTQAIRLYYQFYRVDTDRYHLADGYHQVMLSSRELSQNLPQKARTWVNRYLQFTHGYGVVMNFVSKTVGDGFPQYLLENVPPQSDFGLNITQPAIYYGESVTGYRIVATGIKEFDYPKGNDNVYTSYAGKGGIPLDSYWKRLLFAWSEGDVNILLTSYFTPASRIQIHRNVRERVAQIVPFLQLDDDPYAALSGGRLYWIQDAYTTSDHYPYANPERAWAEETSSGLDDAFNTGLRGFAPQGAANFSRTAFDGLNYIRNSVKVVVDMYDGTVRFFIIDPKDPILAAYRKAFPGLFGDLAELSTDLKEHLRYPEDLFSIQGDQYRTFHMTDPQVFYNREDLWTSPLETYGAETLEMQPYYILTKLPGSSELEYMLMTPFTPKNRDNMISWMAARSDFPEYGRMICYQLPKEKLVYGPNQIEAIINQDTTISQQLTLWNQNGSRVIRGKQIVTPIGNSFLYVTPLYLIAEGAKIPQLKRVIAVAGDKVAMEPTLDEALTALFGAPQSPAGAHAAPEPLRSQPSNLQAPEFENTKKAFDDAQEALKRGDWIEFGKAMDALKRQLDSPAVR